MSKITFIGSGNVASHLAKAFFKNGDHIVQIYSKSLANAQALANNVLAESITNLDELDQYSDIYIIAVSDQAIPSVIDQLSENLKGIVVHTSGATSLHVLDKFKQSGVIYPPQSLNKNVSTSISDIPFGIEGSSEEVTSKLLNIVQIIAPKSFICDSEQRLAIHVSAVIANNFSNILFDISQNILEKHQIDFEVLKPIILETATKVQHHKPYDVQTGPAIREDCNTINKHLQFLSYSDDLTKIYQLLSDFIIKRHHK